MPLVDPEHVYTLWLPDKWHLCEHRFAYMWMKHHLSVLCLRSMFVIVSFSGTRVILSAQTFQFIKFGHSRMYLCLKYTQTFLWTCYVCFSGEVKTIC